MKTKLVGDFSGIHGIGKILFVSEDEKESIAKLVLVEHPLEFLPSLRNTFPIIRINHEDDTLGVLVVYEGMRRRWRHRGVRTYNASREDGSCPDLRRPTQ